MKSLYNYSTEVLVKYVNNKLIQAINNYTVVTVRKTYIHITFYNRNSTGWFCFQNLEFIYLKTDSNLMTD
jgi:hypothetical protein